MSSQTTKLILAGLAVAATAQDFNIINNCPDGELYINNGNSWCCPGAVYGDDNNNNEAYCCVGARFDVAGPSFACFPFCSGTTEDVTVTSTTQEICSATVMLTDEAYSSKVSAAAATIPSLGTTATGGARVSTAAGGMSSGTTSGGGDGGNASQTGSSSSSEAGAAAIITSGPMMGAIMVAGGCLLAV